VHYKDRGVFIETEHPVIGWEVVYGEPWRWLKGAGPTITRAPMLGEANEYVIKKLLGRSNEEYDRLVADKVLN
jgi:crotonobetainyl-CoA:carnitine CoA-transferase CaiB-like acyl-CoA transferase